MPVSSKPRKPISKWKSKTPPALPVGDHSVGNGWYHPTKGWRKTRKPTNNYLINTLLMPLGIAPF